MINFLTKIQKVIPTPLYFADVHNKIAGLDGFNLILMRSKIGVEKLTLIVTYIDLNSNSYSDLCDTLDTLTLTFICNF